MLVKNPKYRKQLSDKQIRILKLVFKFRFVSIPLLAAWLAKDKSSVYEQLVGLVEQGYLCKQYDRSYRLQLRPASYGLAAKGVKYLRDTTSFSETALRNMYKNKTASELLVVQSLNAFKLCLQLKQQYPDTFDIFTKSEMTHCNDFIRPLPDLYLQRKSNRSTKPNYLLETIEAGTMTWILRKRLQAHQESSEEHEDTWGKYPTLLFICGNSSTEKRLHRLYNNGYADFDIMTTTAERLASDDTKIWIPNEWDTDWDEEPAFNRL